jgi:5-formyltetrahydrofolate cyclo-ligase
VGVGFEVQVQAEPLPQEPQDVRLDFLLTEKGMVKL